jgi:hypothetical protein
MSNPRAFDEGYYLDSILVLRIWGTQNLFVGRMAGLAGPNTGSQNTFVGDLAGKNNTSGILNA